jgi:hypothetical protein
MCRKTAAACKSLPRFSFSWRWEVLNTPQPDQEKYIMFSTPAHDIFSAFFTWPRLAMDQAYHGKRALLLSKSDFEFLFFYIPFGIEDSFIHTIPLKSSPSTLVSSPPRCHRRPYPYTSSMSPAAPRPQAPHGAGGRGPLPLD